MSVARPDRIDAVGVRDGWVVVSIHEFDAWTSFDEPEELFRAKLHTCMEHVESAAFQARWHLLPVRVELVSRDPVPEEIAALCRRFGVALLEGD